MNPHSSSAPVRRIGAEGMGGAQALPTFYTPFERSGPFEYDAEGCAS